MIIELTFPAQSPTMTEGTLVSWRIKKGDQVKKLQVIAEVQTDKAVTEWESPEGGTVAEILIPAGAMAIVNQVAAIMTTKGEDASAAIAKAKATNAKMAAAGAPADKNENTSQAAGSSPGPAPAMPAMPAQTPGKAAPSGAPAKGVRVSPVASRIAAANRIDLGLLRGSGPDGRIVKRDVESAVASGSAKIV